MEKKITLNELRNLIRKVISEQFREVSDEDWEWAKNYLEKDVSADALNDKSYYYIDVTGKLGVYLTLWRFNHKVINGSPVKFIQNLSQNFKDAVKKAKEKFPGRKILIFDGTTQLPHLRDSLQFPFGKYKNQNIYDVASTNEGKNYIKWCVSKWVHPSEERQNNTMYGKDYLNIEITKNPYRNTYVERKFNEKEKAFVETLKEFAFALDLEKYGVNKDNKSERQNENLNKFSDLLSVLKSKPGSPFIQEFIKKIEGGADTKMFSEKINTILSDVYSKNFPKEQVAEKYNEMFSKLTGTEINNIEAGQEYIVGNKYTETLECLSKEEVSTKFGLATKFSFINNAGNKFYNLTTSSLNINVGETKNMSFTVKESKVKNGEFYYYIKNVKIVN